MHISGYLFSFKDTFQTLFGLKDEQTQGRTCMACSSILSTIVSSMTSGIFYTGFLLGNKIDLSGIGIITFIPYLASLVSLLAPSLLERFPRRRFLLGFLRASQWTINLLGMTLMPLFITDPNAKILWFCIISFLGSALGGLCTAGFTPWHLNFIPNNVRASYFLYSSLFTNLIGGLFLILSSVIADALTGSPYEMTIIIILRYTAFALAILEVFIMTRPKEYPYPQALTRPRPGQVFSLPFRNRKFLKTEMIYVFYTLFSNLSASVLNAYLLSSVGVTYTLINVMNLCYALFLFLFAPFWQRRIGKWGWLRTLSVTLLSLVPTYVLYMFIGPGNYLFLFPLMRLIQHFIGVGHDTCVGNLLFLNIPEENRSCFVSFNTVVTNLASLSAMMLGTGFVAYMGDRSVTIGTLSFSSVPLLLGLTATGFLCLSFFIRRNAASLEPQR